MVDITRQGIDRSADVPESVTIRAAETVMLNISSITVYDENRIPPLAK
jgi:hypothetical protein